MTSTSVPTPRLLLYFPSLFFAELEEDSQELIGYSNVSVRGLLDV